jgi:hypothetical protein
MPSSVLASFSVPNSVLQKRCWYLETRLPNPLWALTKCFLVRASSVSCTVASFRSSTGSRLLFWLQALTNARKPHSVGRQQAKRITVRNGS